MKKYFVKFVPIEGEIKEGDWYKSKFRTENKFFHYEQWKDDRTTYFGFDAKEDVICKVKLFLCSRDVPPHYSNPHVEYYDGVKEENRYYVAGEISPGAIWVKEGDEFDEDEVKYNKTMTMLGQKDEDAFYYLIKCPTCKQFH